MNYPFHKPEENHPPGKDSTKGISNLIGKAAKLAGSAKSKKVTFNSPFYLRQYIKSSTFLYNEYAHYESYYMLSSS